jgi:hypothetical protein
MTMPEDGSISAAEVEALPPPGVMSQPFEPAFQNPAATSTAMVPAPMPPMMQPGYGMPPMEAAGQMPAEGSHMLGLATLAVGVGGLLGYRYGGIYGSLAGGLVGGALVNGYRALYYYQEGTEDGDKEAGVAATYAVLSGAVATYLVAKHVEPRTDDDEDDEDEYDRALPNPEVPDDELPLVAPAGPCAMRSVGPRVVPTAEVLEAAEVED